MQLSEKYTIMIQPVKISEFTSRMLKDFSNHYFDHGHIKKNLFDIFPIELDSQWFIVSGTWKITDD